MFLGVEALTLGILNALQLIPTYEKRLQASVERDPDYFYSMAAILRAKILIKTPPRPLSIGNVSKGLKVLDNVSQSARNKMAIWHLFYAEGELLLEGPGVALKRLHGIQDSVLPVDIATAVTLDQTLSDAVYFESVIEKKKYNKYTWDPVLIPAKPSAKFKFTKTVIKGPKRD